MPQPTAYAPIHDYSSELGTEHGQHLDDEFNAIRTTLLQILANLTLIQRDDGALKNAVVTYDSLSNAVYQLLAGVAASFKGAWLTGTTYVAKDSVTEAGSTYLCATGHVAGTFATDLAAGKWILMQSPSGTITSTGVVVTPYGTVGSSTLQGAIQELADEKAQLTGSAASQFAVATATTSTSAVPMSQAQGNSLNFAVGAGTGDVITATINPSGLTALANGMEVFIRAPGANSLTTPTLALTLGATNTGAVTIVRATTGGALAAGSIAGSSHLLQLVYNSSLNKWQLLNPAA